jgi:signal transduction histidine kinase
MTIRRRLTTWFASILAGALLVIALAMYYEWTEQQHRFREKMEPEGAWEEVGEVVVVFGVPAALIIVVIAAWVLKKSLAPLTALTCAVERIQINNLKERLPRLGNADEIDRLADVFNSMMGRLENSFTQIRDFTLHASHELKTPLTILRAHIETRLRDGNVSDSDRELFADQLEEIDRLTKIVDALTLLAKTDAGQLAFAQEPLRLDELVRDCFADAQLLGQPDGVHIELRACDSVTVRGDRYRLRQLLLNLAENAVKYNRPQGEVVMSLNRHNGTAELAISNTGPGIPPDKIPRVFERFYRGDAAHSGEGCGLGLSIVQSIARAHGGTVDLVSKTDERTTVTVRLPVA